MATMLIHTPLPASWGLREVKRREGTKSPSPKAGDLRSYTGPFTVTEGDAEAYTTEETGNSGHNVELNAEQFARMREIETTLRAGKAEDATDEERAARKALLATIKKDGGIALPMPEHSGRKGTAIDDLSDLLAD